MGSRVCLDLLENRKTLAFDGIRTPDRPNHNLVIIPTKISQILVRYGYKEITKSTSLGLDSRSFQSDRRQANEKEDNVQCTRVYEINIYFGLKSVKNTDALVVAINTLRTGDADLRF